MGATDYFNNDYYDYNDDGEMMPPTPFASYLNYDYSVRANKQHIFVSIKKS